MKKLFITLLLFLTTSVFAQETRVRIDSTGIVPIIIVRDNSLNDMCYMFAQNLGIDQYQGIQELTLSPKLSQFYTANALGGIWDISDGRHRRMEVASDKLPAILQKIRGPEAAFVLYGGCFLRHTKPYSINEMILITSTIERAEAIVKLLTRP